MDTQNFTVLARESDFNNASSAASTNGTAPLIKQPQKIQPNENFLSAQMLKLFTKQSTIAQKEQMRNLHLKLDLNNDPVETALMLDQFNNLQHLKLEIIRGCAFDSLSSVERDAKWRDASNRWLFLIVQLRKLPLEFTEIVLHDGDVKASYNIGNLDPCSFYDFGINGTMPKKLHWPFERSKQEKKATLSTANTHESTNLF